MSLQERLGSVHVMQVNVNEKGRWHEGVLAIKYRQVLRSCERLMNFNYRLQLELWFGENELFIYSYLINCNSLTLFTSILVRTLQQLGQV